MLRWIGLFTLLLVLLTGSNAAADIEYERETLRGLRGIRVVVERLPPEAERDGLTRSTIQTDVELKLRQAGIPLLSRADRPPGSPYLYVNVNTYQSRVGLYAFSVQAGLVQFVILERNRNITSQATTWEATGSVGAVGSEKLSEVRNAVRDMVDEFINAYLAVNPKQ